MLKRELASDFFSSLTIIPEIRTFKFIILSVLYTFRNNYTCFVCSYCNVDLMHSLVHILEIASCVLLNILPYTHCIIIFLHAQVLILYTMYLFRVVSWGQEMNAVRTTEAALDQRVEEHSQSHQTLKSSSPAIQDLFICPTYGRVPSLF